MRAKILNASAGSGKTYQLAYKYVRDVVEQPSIYRHILAVTFTNKATEEMKSRILKEIHLLASGGESSYLENLCRELDMDAATVRRRAAEVRSKILHDYSRFTVLTIDTFFQRILRAFIKELGIDLNYNVEIETASVLTKSADTLIEQITTDRDLQRWLTDFVQERIDEGKKWDVRDGILTLGGELFKEKNKEALSLARSREELGRIVGEATARAAATKQQMRERAAEAVRIMADAGVGPADFTGKSRSFAHYFLTVAAGELKPYTATVGKMSLTTEGWAPKGSPAAPLAARLQPLLREMCDLYDANVRSWNTCDLLRENYRSFALLSDLYAKVQQLCDEQNMMLLSETKYILSEFIGHNDAPFIYEKVGNRFEHFMIDEFQDTSTREWENFLPLLGNAMAQSEQTSVLIVGDIKQSIYRWRGGDWEILHRRAARELGEASTETIHLKENFRSLPLVVEFNNRMIGKVVESDNTALNQLLAQAPPHALGGKAREELRDTLQEAYCEHAQSARKKGLHPGYVNITHYTGEPPLIERIKALVDKGFRPKDMMILVRSGTDGAKVASALLDFKRRNTDPRYRFDVMTQEALIVGTAPISSFVIACLKLAMNPADSLSRAIYNHFSAKPSFDAELTEEEVVFLKSLRLFPPEEAFERIVMRYDLQERREEIAYLQAVHEQIINFCAGRVADIPLFLKWWDEQGSGRSLSVEQGETTIEITTIHKAKGLEKKVVLIPYCNWTLNPKSSGLSANIVWAEGTDGELEEIGRFPVRYKTSMGESLFSADYYREMIYAHVDNINLLYVALTRAVESLHIFIPQKGAKGPNVGQLILQNIAPEDGTVRLDGLEGSCSRDEAAETYEFGEFAGPEPDTHRKAKAAHVLLGDYPTSEPQLQLRLPTERYYEEEGRAELTPRDFGILMHRVFENAATTDEIYMAIEAMTQDGVLDEKEAPRLRELVEKALADPVTAEWFGGRWQVVRNENEIILPGSGTTRRPDRVMTDGERAVVVDYKFGDRETARHRKQIREYLRLLRQMGYTRTEGYLWYVRLGRTERVEEKED